MKNRILKKLFLLLIAIFAFGIFFFANSKAEAANCTDEGAFDIYSVVTEQYAEPAHTPKVMPNEEVLVTVKNNCDTNKIKYNIYIYPETIAPGEGGGLDPEKNIASYLKVENLVLSPLKDHMSRIKIEGTEPGDFKIRVVPFLLNNDESIIKRLGVKEKELIIAKIGIELGSDSSTSFKQGEVGRYTIKFFNHSGETFSIYIDDIDVNKLKTFTPIPITSNEFTYSGFSWDTAGTSPGAHKIIVVLGDGQSKSFDITIIDPLADDGSNASSNAGFSLLKLDSYNIKTLLTSCSKDNLDGVLCIVETVINWLLDIGAVISFIMILYASIIYLTSYGEESKVELAKKTLIWSVIGVIVIGAAKVIMLIIQNILNNPSAPF